MLRNLTTQCSFTVFPFLGQFHQHFTCALFVDILLQKIYEAKTLLETSFAKHFRTKNLRVKCWWNWPLGDRKRGFFCPCSWPSCVHIILPSTIFLCPFSSIYDMRMEDQKNFFFLSHHVTEKRQQGHWSNFYLNSYWMTSQEYKMMSQ